MTSNATLKDKLATNKICSSSIATPIGNMTAVADDNHLLLLEFYDSINIKNKLNKLKEKLKTEIIEAKNSIIENIEHELKQYFSGSLIKFTTPTNSIGTEFQQQVWNQLKKIPFAKTISYSTVAKELNRPKAFRAVANANGANSLAIVIPCHRVVQVNNNMGGYAGGIERKKWLLEHEANVKSMN